MMTPPRPPVTPLRPDQLEPATAPVGPVLILGGAGSGLTHTIAARIAVWLKQGVIPLDIACLTHSAGGGNDIRRRVREFLPDEDPFLGIYTGTPQQLALYLLRLGGMEVLGRSAGFTVWQRDEARASLAELLAANGRKPERVDAEAARLLDWRRLNRAGFPGDRIPPGSPDWPDLVATYQAEKERQNVVDCGDLVALVTLALERDRDFREETASSTSRHLFIDGLQDLAPAEYGMARLLTGPEQSITVAANPNAVVCTDADYRVLEAFGVDFPEADKGAYLLKMNARSTAAIGKAVTRISHDPAMGHLIGEQHRYFRRTAGWARHPCPWSLQNCWCSKAGPPTCTGTSLTGPRSSSHRDMLSGTSRASTRTPPSWTTCGCWPSAAVCPTPYWEAGPGRGTGTPGASPGSWRPF